MPAGKWKYDEWSCVVAMVEIIFLVVLKSSPAVISNNLENKLGIDFDRNYNFLVEFGIWGWRKITQEIK